MAGPDKEPETQQEFRYPEGEAALNRSMIRQDGGGFVEDRISDGTVMHWPRQRLEARNDALDSPHCPHCRGRMARWGDQRPKSSPAIRAFVNSCRPNLHRMRYDVSTRQGLTCGSGRVEGGCRTVVVDRLKKSGSRWSVDGANAIMAIRCGQMNNRAADLFHWRTTA